MQKMANVHYIEQSVLRAAQECFILVRAESSDISDKMADKLTINELIDWAS